MAILKCTCSHEFQDKKYGRGRRVHNPTSRGTGSDQVFRCTVCLNERARKAEHRIIKKK